MAKVLPRGDLCCGAFDCDKLVSYAWRSGLEADHVPGIKVVVAEHCRYSYKAFTRPEYRGRGIYPRLTRLEDREYMRSSKTTVVAFTATHNYPSLQLDKKLGNNTIGLAGYWEIGRHFLIFHTPGVKNKVSDSYATSSRTQVTHWKPELRQWQPAPTIERLYTNI